MEVNEWTSKYFNNNENYKKKKRKNEKENDSSPDPKFKYNHARQRKLYKKKHWRPFLPCTTQFTCIRVVDLVTQHKYFSKYYELLGPQSNVFFQLVLIS